MNGQSDMLPLSARMSDPDYPGVISNLGPDWRLSVSSGAVGYSLQRRADTPDGIRWVPAGGRSPKTADRIAAKYSADVPGLAALCADLPADPALALAKFTAMSNARSEHMSATDWRQNDYPGEVARDGSLRIVVTPCRTNYRLQWIAKRDIERPGVHWRTVCTAERLCGLDAFALAKVGRIVGPGPDGVLRGEDLLPRWLLFVRGLPVSPADAVLPRLPRARS